MNQTAHLNNIDRIIFDMDGVLTSEENYWNSAALAVYELLNSTLYFGDKTLDLQEVFAGTAAWRKTLFCDDAMIVMLKNRGVNTNWDLAYLAFAGIIGLGTTDYASILEYYTSLDMMALALYEHADTLLQRRFGGKDCSRLGSLWLLLQSVFNEWYYGDVYFEAAYGKKPAQQGKPGFMAQEQPLHPLGDTVSLLEALSGAGITLAIGTGRPRFELEVPMNHWGLNRFFAPNNCINHDDIAVSSKKLNRFLSKPDPFTFLKAAFGKDYDDHRIAAGDYDHDYISRVLVVGDAGADILAAKAMGARFAAVLTGINGKDARKYFEDEKADYIFDNALMLSI